MDDFINNKTYKENNTIEYLKKLLQENEKLFDYSSSICDMFKNPIDGYQYFFSDQIICFSNSKIASAGLLDACQLDDLIKQVEKIIKNKIFV